LTSTRRRFASLIVLGLAAVLGSCSGDVVLPNESRAALITLLSGDKQSAPAGATLGLPLVVRVSDALNRPVEGQTVAFTIDAGGGQVTPASAKTGPDGQASASWTLGGGAGQQQVQAKVSGDGVPDTLVVKFHASAVSGSGASLQLVNGDNQTAPVNSALRDSLVVRVVDQFDNPVAGVTVQWTAGGGGSISPAAVLTGPDGKAAAERVLGNLAGTQSSQAASVGLNSVGFTHTADAANPTVLVLVSGNNQTGSVGAPLADSLVVRLEDANGNGVGGKAITWVPSLGSGSVQPKTVNTNPNGLAKTQWTLGSKADTDLLVNAVFSGLPSVPFTATAAAGAPTKLAFTQAPVNTSAGATITPAVRVTIQDAAGNTVTSATDAVTVAIGTNPGGGTLSGTATVSAVNGVATFSNLSIDKTGNGYRLTAASGALAGATSSAFDILPGNANRLVFIEGPTNRVVGQPFSPGLQVQVQDAGGNPVLLATNQITLTSSVTGTLSGTAVATPFFGTATFSNLAINKAGTGYTLTAFSSGVTSTTSQAFDVTQASTTIAITNRTPGSSLPGQNVRVDYDVNIVSPGAGSLTGSVTVSDGTTSCTGAINAGSGAGNCSLALPTAGTHDLTATYSGDANFLGSSSPVVQHTVNKANTTITIAPETPDPSVAGAAVTVQWSLTSSGTAPLTGTVVLTVPAEPGTTCSAPASLGTGSCPLTFLTSGSRPITATYSGDANYSGSTDNEPHSVSAANTAPTADDDGPYIVQEDGTLDVSAGSGVLKGDTDPESNPLTAVIVAGPTHAQSFTLNTDGSFSYTPAADYAGDDSFTYQANDGGLNSNVATVTITVTPVNDAPSFSVGADQNVSALAGPQSVSGWATGISAGPADESGQTVSFEVSIPGSNDGDFADPPQVSGAGTLTYTPNPLSLGATVTVTVRAVDDGGTDHGGHDTSDPQTFSINISP
jgi:hypothetical protein